MEEIKKAVKEIRESQIRMEADVKHHIKRTDLLEELHKDNAKRIEKLEQPVQSRKYLKEQVISISKFAGAVLAIAAVIKLFL